MKTPTTGATDIEFEVSPESRCVVVRATMYDVDSGMDPEPYRLPLVNAIRETRREYRSMSIGHLYELCIKGGRARCDDLDLVYVEGRIPNWVPLYLAARRGHNKPLAADFEEVPGVRAAINTTTQAMNNQGVSAGDMVKVHGLASGGPSEPMTVTNCTLYNNCVGFHGETPKPKPKPYDEEAGRKEAEALRDDLLGRYRTRRERRR